MISYRRSLLKVISFVGSKKFLHIIIVWFIFQTVWMAVSTRTSLPPDESTHFNLIRLYAQDGPDPFIQNQTEEFYGLGDAIRTPGYLYHYLMSFPYRALPDSIPVSFQVVLLRLVNLVFSLGGILVFAKALNAVIKRPIVKNLTLLMLTNTLMFVFLSSSVNYDNLLFFLVNLAFLYFIKLTRKPGVLDLLKLGIVMMAASLTKFTFLPLGLLILCILLIKIWRKLPGLFRDVRQVIQRRPFIFTFLSLLLLLMLGLFTERYIVNYARYGTYKPQCDQVLTYEQCTHSPLFVRNLAFRENSVEDRVPEVSFVFRWAERMKEGIFGILAHRFVDETSFTRFAPFLVMLIMVTAVVFGFERKLHMVNTLLLAAAAYTTILLFHNYFLYQKSGMFGLALQGRYVFPVLGLYYLGGSYYIDKLLRNKQSYYAILLLLITVIFFISALPTYIYITNVDWHTSFMHGSNVFIKRIMRALVP